MHWQVVIPGEGGAPPAAVEVDADNWFTALRSALSKLGRGGQLISNLKCDIKPDRSVLVTDFVTRRTYTLVPANAAQVPAAPAPAPAAPAPAPAAPAPAPAAPAPAPAPGAQAETAASRDLFVVEGLPADLPPHTGFSRRDGPAPGSNGIFLRERLLAVAPGTDREEAVRLAMAVFERLHALGAGGGGRLVVSVQIYDHVFRERFERPAIATLEWSEWSPKKAKFQFPLSGAEELRFSRVPGPPAAGAERQPGEAAPPPPEAEPISLVEKRPEPIPLVEKRPEPVPLVERRPEPVPLVERRPERAGEDPQRKRPTGEGAVLDDVFFLVFERMHEIYGRRDHDEVAAVAIGIAREFIPCEAASGMLITPGKYELYVAAAQGEVAGALRGKRMSLTAGIVGFATRAGAVVTVTDPENDPRFHGEFDKLTGFRTRNVLCAPLQFEGKTIGAIELLNTPRPAGFLQSEANLLSYIAGAVAEYIDTSLPSREAEFTDRDFAEFTPARRAGARSPAAAPPPGDRSVVKSTMAETPAAKVAQAPPGSKHPPKHKKKRR